jgi:PIN domain nuclease of toxin-antitoxin system
MEDERNEKLLSIASVWEMAIKVSLGKLHMADPIEEVIDRGTRDAGIAILGISRAHAIRVASLPWHHRDPFDRMLAAQALEEQVALVARDAVFDGYGVRRLW